MDTMGRIELPEQTALILLRSAQSRGHDDGLIQGHGPYRLTDAGIEQARALAPVIESCGATVLASSTLHRARETALALGANPILLLTSPDFAGQDTGSFTGVHKSVVAERYPWFGTDVFPGWQPPTYETEYEVNRRIRSGIGLLLTEHEMLERPLVAVSHGSAIRTLERTMGLDAEPIPHLAGVILNRRGEHLGRINLNAELTADQLQPA